MNTESRSVGWRLGIVVALAALAGAAAAQATRGELPRQSGQPTAADPLRRLEWWRAARFGMFIHWGLYAIPAGEWNGKTDYGEWIRNNAQIPIDVYDRFRGGFNPAAFDPGGWARLARRAGMKYLVITTKHHDGFCLFDSKQTSFTVSSTPFNRDVMKELAAACRREGIRVGWYYSIMDWHHPDYLPRRPWESDRPAAGADFERYVGYLKAQVKELLTNYGPIDIMWFDGQWEDTWNGTRGRDLYDYVRSLQPGIIVNNRVGGKHGDFGTPEQEIPATGTPGLDWETCMTMNGNWGFNRADKNFKPVPVLIRTLVETASKGGNLLLNVGPDADGRIPAESVERLDAVGKWMDVNGASIYATAASPFTSLPWGRATVSSASGDRTIVYLHVFDWPSDGRLVVDGLRNTPRRAVLLADPAKRPLLVGRKDGRLVITVPRTPLDPADTVVALEIEGRPDVVPTAAARPW